MKLKNKVSKIVTRRQVIEAIRKEPLTAGKWFQSNKNGTNFEKCSVCGVAAILRKVSFVHAALERGEDPFDMVKNLANETSGQNKILAKLSEEFERKFHHYSGPSLTLKRITKKSRESFVEWIRQNIPVKFEVKYDFSSWGAK